jgi:integrase
MTQNRAQKVLALAGARHVSDLSLSKALDALATLRADGLGPETINHHIRAVKAFARWLWKDGRAREHYLAHLATVNPESDRRRRRRALTPVEAGRLVQAAERGPVVMGMTGPDRARCYALALGSGLRASELASLTPERFDVDASPPTVTVHPGYTKNGREAVRPLAPTLAKRLAPWLATLPRTRPVFNMPDRTAEMLRVDLEAAGIAYETPSGVCDFHSLRGVYISNLVASGASVKTCQVLARHSTPSLTIGIYAKASLHDISSAVDALPDLSPEAPAPEATAATGTDGRHIKTRPSLRRGRNRAERGS